MVNKFAHVTGGADQNCLAVIDALADRGHEVAILSTASDANTFRDGEFVELRVTHRRRESLGARESLDVAARAFWNPDSARAMHRLLDRFRPDVVHAHKLYPQLSVAPVVVAARAGLPLVQTLHDYELLSASALDATGGWIDRDEARLPYRAINTATFPIRRTAYAPRITRFIACSRYLAERYRAKRGMETTVMPYFIEPAGAELRGFSERDGAVFVGRLHEEKGVLDVIRMAELAPSIAVKVVGYGPLEGAVEEAAARLPNLEYLGRMDRAGIFGLLGRARVSLMPSLWQEPGGIAALEAMAVGTPVVAYANGGLAEYVSDTGGGRVIDPDAHMLAGAARELHDNESEWRERSNGAVEGVTRLHSRDGYIDRLEELYEGAIASRSPTFTTQ